MRDTPFDETEFARTEHGNPRKGKQHEVRQAIWEQLRSDEKVAVDIPQAVLDQQPGGFVDGLEKKSKADKPWTWRR